MKIVPRPVKWRKVSFIPGVRYFLPAGVSQYELEEVVLKVEELEAIRLKDVEGLEQEACADRMEVSRPTFQRILNTARAKVAEALVNGKAIRIEGGNFTSNICPVICLGCKNEWEEKLQKVLEGDYSCPKCDQGHSLQILPGRRFCGGRCYDIMDHPGTLDHTPPEK